MERRFPRPWVLSFVSASIPDHPSLCRNVASINVTTLRVRKIPQSCKKHKFPSDASSVRSFRRRRPVGHSLVILEIFLVGGWFLTYTLCTLVGFCYLCRREGTNLCVVFWIPYGKISGYLILSICNLIIITPRQLQPPLRTCFLPKCTEPRHPIVIGPLRLIERRHHTGHTCHLRKTNTPLRPIYHQAMFR